MGNFIGKFEISVLPTMTAFEGNRYPLIRTIDKTSINQKIINYTFLSDVVRFSILYNFLLNIS